MKQAVAPQSIKAVVLATFGLPGLESSIGMNRDLSFVVVVTFGSVGEHVVAPSLLFKNPPLLEDRCFPSLLPPYRNALLGF